MTEVMANECTYILVQINASTKYLHVYAIKKLL